MAHFRGTVQGVRGMASRLGNKNSGMVAHINGWDIGVSVRLAHNPTTGLDEVAVYLNSGSNDRESHIHLFKTTGTFEEERARLKKKNLLGKE